MIQSAIIIGTGLATTGLMGAGIVFGAALVYLPYIISVAIIITLLMMVFITISAMEMPGVDMPGMPGVRCPVCASRGIETWVLPGKHCPKCGCACDW